MADANGDEGSSQGAVPGANGEIDEVTPLEPVTLDVSESGVVRPEDTPAIDGDTDLHRAARCSKDDAEKVGAMLQHGADIGARNEYGETPLYTACEEGHVYFARELLKAGAGISGRSYNGSSPLDAAVLAGHGGVVLVMIEHGVDVLSTDSEGYTALHKAKGKSVVDMLIQAGAVVNAVTKLGRTPLHSAANDGRVVEARVLMEAGADPLLRTNNGHSALDIAVGLEKDDVVRMMIEHGVDVTSADNQGVTALNEAKGKSVVDMLIEAGAAVDAIDKFGRTPLRSAACDGRVEVARVLLKAGADPLLRDKDGFSSVDAAVGCEEDDVVRMMIEIGVDMASTDSRGRTALCFVKGYNMVNILIKGGADICARMSTGETPLHIAAGNGYIEATRALMSAGADPLLRNNKGASSVDMAVAFEHDDVVRMMIESGVDMTSANSSGRTALHEARGRCMVDMLIGAGADTGAKTTSGRTPLHCAAREDRVEAARALLEQGADPLLGDNSKMSSVDFAVFSDHEDVLRVMIELKVDLVAANTSGFTALHWAKGKVVVDMLIKAGVDIGARTNTGETPLHIAAGFGRLEATRTLMAAGADPIKRNKNGMSSLDFAVKRQYGDVVRLMIESGVDMNATSENGTTAIFYAKDTGMVGILVKGAADTEARRRDNYLTPLLDMVSTSIFVYYEEMVEAVRALLEHGANVNALADDGDNCLHILTNYRSCGIEMLELLVENGANIECEDKFGETPLKKGIRQLNAVAVKGLLDFGAKQEWNGETALAWAINCDNGIAVQHVLATGADIRPSAEELLPFAARRGWVEYTKMTLDIGVDLDISVGSKATVLHVACGEEIVGMLIERGAEIDARDAFGSTSLHYCFEDIEDEGPYDTWKLPELRTLVKHGADVNIVNEHDETVLHYAAKLWPETMNDDHLFEVVDLFLRAGADENIRNDEGQTAMDILRESEEEEDEVKAVIELLNNAPKDRAWRRRGWLVMLRARKLKEMEAMVMPEPKNSRGGGGSDGQDARLVDFVVRLEEEGVFREVVAFL